MCCCCSTKCFVCLKCAKCLIVEPLQSCCGSINTCHDAKCPAAYTVCSSACCMLASCAMMVFVPVEWSGYSFLELENIAYPCLSATCGALSAYHIKKFNSTMHPEGERSQSCSSRAYFCVLGLTNSIGGGAFLEEAIRFGVAASGPQFVVPASVAAAGILCTACGVWQSLEAVKKCRQGSEKEHELNVVTSQPASQLIQSDPPTLSVTTTQPLGIQSQSTNINIHHHPAGTKIMTAPTTINMVTRDQAPTVCTTQPTSNGLLNSDMEKPIYFSQSTLPAFPFISTNLSPLTTAPTFSSFSTLPN